MRWLSRLVVAVVVVMATGCTGSAPQPPGDAAGRPPPGGRPGIPLGAFLGSDGYGVEAIARFEAWLGAPVTVGHTYLPGNSWDDIEGPAWLLEPWLAWRTADPTRMLVLNVPMAAPNEDALTDEKVGDLLRAGAAGAFDRHFRVLGERLVAGGGRDTILVLGREMNGTTYGGRCAPDPEAWKSYWRRIVGVMRSVTGQAFRFDFAPVRGEQAIAWPRCYPGDDVVDIIGMDSYDQRPGRTFADYLDQPYGLRAHAEFAAERGKPMSFPEWGLFDFGDNPEFVRRMHDWMHAHDVVYQTITDYCPHGVWECQANPDSSEAYRRLFSVSASRPPGR